MERKPITNTRITPELLTMNDREAPPPPPPPLVLPRRADTSSFRDAFSVGVLPRGRAERPWLLVAILIVLTALVAVAHADDVPEEDSADATELPDEPAWDPETRGTTSANTSTPTASGLRFAMELHVGLATRPVSIDAAGPSGGKIVVFTTGRWKAAAGPEKSYAVILERMEGTRWIVVDGARRARLAQGRVRNEWHVRDRASYRVTVMARKKGTSGPLLRVEGEVRTVIHR